MGDTRLTDLNYADDAVLLTDDQSQLQPALQRLEEEASKFGLHVSWAKTKVQNLGSGQEVAPIAVNGEVVEAVDSFVYLGSTMSSGSNSYSEVMRRIGLASSITDRLSRIWSQRHLSLTTKFRLYSCCILAVLLYACETWTLTKADWKRLESFHLRCQRRILGIKWSDFVTNAEVYARSGL